MKRLVTIGRLVLLSIIAVSTAVVVLFVLGMGACSVVGAWTGKAMDKIQVGDSKAAVIAEMGSPSVIETSTLRYSRYTDHACDGACMERLWYEHRVCDEAWWVELDKQYKVIDKGRVFSP